MKRGDLRTSRDDFGLNLGLPGGTRTPDPQLRRLVLYPVELRAASPARLVGAAGFELATYWSQTSCATRLRYAPNECDCTRRSTRAASALRRPLSRRATTAGASWRRTAGMQLADVALRRL